MARPSEISLKMLHAFLTWAESSSEAEAARKLGITQPALHRKLEKFQAQIGSGPRLMHRDRASWKLTAEGRVILPVIRDLVRRYEQLESHLGDRNELPRVLRIVTGQFAAQYILPNAIAALRKNLPDCRIETHAARGRDRILGVANAQYDLALVSHTPDQVHAIIRKQLRTRERLLTCEPFVQYPFVVIAHRDSAEGRSLAKLPAKAAITADQLEGWRLIGLDPQAGLRQRLEQLADPTPLTFATDTHTGGWPAALACTQRGLGAALVPDAVLASQNDSTLVTRAFDESFTLDEFLIARADFNSEMLERAKAALRTVSE
jgi:DNA-binding transcriptional LysR family regulator